MDKKYLENGFTLQSGKYRIEKVLGSGGFGITYLASHTGLGKNVAIKEFFMGDFCSRDTVSQSIIISTSGSKTTVEAYRAKFIKEARNLANIEHTNIVNVSDVFEENDSVYYVMKYLDGISLQDYVKQNGALPQDEAIRYINQIGNALAYMHLQNMCHFDVKPGNIMITREGIAVLIDFGISKKYDNTGNQTSTTPIGISKGYTPIEQYQGDLQTFSPTSDIYSLGATLYYMVTGEVPPEASDVNENGLPSMPDTISPQIRNTIKEAMLPRRGDRPQSIGEFIKLLNGNSVSNSSITPPPPSNFNNDDKTSINTPENISHNMGGGLPPLPKKNNYWVIPVVVLSICIIGIIGWGAYTGVNQEAVSVPHNATVSNDNSYPEYTESVSPSDENLTVTDTTAIYDDSQTMTKEEFIDNGVANLNKELPLSIGSDDIPLTLQNTIKEDSETMRLNFTIPYSSSDLSASDVDTYKNYVEQLINNMMKAESFRSDIYIHGVIYDDNNNIVCSVVK